MFRKEDKIEVLQEFIPRSQYSCTKCIQYKRVKQINDLFIGSHVCFEEKLKFYHAIVSDINPVSESRVQLNIIHASRKRELAVVKRLFGKQFTQHDIIVEEHLPEINITTSNVYLVEYNKRVCNNEMALKRALSQIHKYRERVPRSYGSIVYQRLPSEPENIDETSERFASWCMTGECVSLNARSSRDCIEYTRSATGISMFLKVTSDKDPVESAAVLHQQRLLCDSCFLTEVVRIVNAQNTPETKYRLPTTISAWVQDRQTPNGLYRVRFTPLVEELSIKIKSYNAKSKRRASIEETDAFVFSLVPGRKCEVKDAEIFYKCCCPF